MILLQGNAARRKGVRSMLGVGMDTHYGFYDPGCWEKSLSIDTVGTSASTLIRQTLLSVCRFRRGREK